MPLDPATPAALPRIRQIVFTPSVHAPSVGHFVLYWTFSNAQWRRPKQSFFIIFICAVSLLPLWRAGGRAEHTGAQQNKPTTSSSFVSHFEESSLSLCVLNGGAH